MPVDNAYEFAMRQAQAAQERFQEVNTTRLQLLASGNFSAVCPQRPETCNGIAVIDGFEIECEDDTCPFAKIRAEYQASHFLSILGFGIDAQKPDFDRIPVQISKAIERYVETLPKRIEQGNGLTIGGNVGTGKTCAMAYVFLQATKLLPVETWSRMELVDATDLFVLLGERYGDSEEKRDRRKNKNYLFEAPILGIDDLGTEARDKTAMAEFHALINYRHKNQLPTLITTNASMAQFKAMPDYLRVIDRLSERNPWLWVEGESQRRPILASDW